MKKVQLVHGEPKEPPSKQRKEEKRKEEKSERNETQVGWLSCLDHLSSKVAQRCPFPPQSIHQHSSLTSPARAEATTGREGTTMGGEKTRRRR